MSKDTPIKRARKNCNLTQEQVAKAVGISSRQFQSIENEKCRTNIDTATLIADTLQCNDIRKLFPPQMLLRRQITFPSGATEGKAF